MSRRSLIVLWANSSGGVIALAVGMVIGLASLASAEPSIPLTPLNPPGQATPGTTAEIVVPDGSPQELLAFVEKLAQQQGPADAQAMLAFRQKQAQAFVTAADKIIDKAGNDAKLIDAALQWKFRGLLVLLQLGDPQARDLVPAMGKQLVSLAGKVLQSQPQPSKEAAEAAVQWALMGPRLAGPAVLPQVLDLPQQLEKLGYKDLAFGAQGGLLALRMRMRTEEEKNLLSQDVQSYLNAALQMLKDNPNPDENQLAAVLNIVQQLEHSGLDVPAGQYCQSFGEILVKNSNPQIAEVGRQLEGMGRRLGLVGKKMELAGKTLEGKDFDWAQYRGKMVLVDFFATWCGPCRAEMPNLKANYERYSSKGFDVVGISVDEDRAALEDYVKSEKIPWTIIHVQDPNAQGPADPARYYGIVAIPTVILVDRDGTVLTFDARGEALGKKLEELLGPVETPKSGERAPAPAPAPTTQSSATPARG